MIDWIKETFYRNRLAGFEKDPHGPAASERIKLPDPSDNYFTPTLDWRQ
jgi:hypothetical protein